MFCASAFFTFAGSLLFRSDEIFTSEDSDADVGERGSWESVQIPVPLSVRKRFPHHVVWYSVLILIKKKGH